MKVSVSGGGDTVVKTRQVTISDVNDKPIISINPNGMGTQANPKLHPQALSLVASQSYDPDGTLRFAWKLGAISGGQACPGRVVVLFGKETASPSMPIPLVTAFPSNPMRVNFTYRVIDQMYVLQGSQLGYAASATGCTEPGGGGGGNTTPDATPSVGAGSAGFGVSVGLNGNFFDPDSGDTHSFSWTQIKTSGEPTVTPASPTSKSY